MRGTTADFQCYDRTWGRHRSRTYPAPGNHEYETPGATPYYEYFGERAGPFGLGYYSFDVGAWHVVSLNSNVPMSEGSAQLAWLRADLQRRTRAVRGRHHPSSAHQLGAQRRQPAGARPLAHARSAAGADS